MRSFLVVGLATLLAAPSPLAAQGWIEPLPGHPGSAVVNVRSAVTVRVTGRVAQVEVEEWFRNAGSGWGEGDYLYPLPGEAVFSNYSLFQGDKELTGETMDAQQARAIYEEIVRRKRDPALIELAGHGLIRARVFPISPGDTRRITLRYTELMPRVGDALQFRYAAAGRYGTASGVEGAQGPTRRAEAAPLSFRLVADSGTMFGEPFSPTHQLQVRREDGRLIVEPGADLTGDLSLFLPLARGLVGLSVVTHRANDEPGYFMLTVVPGKVDSGEIARDVTVVLDVSGSMSGSKLDQAKQALDQLLGSLHGADRFRLASFSSTLTTYRNGWTPASPDAIREARRWVEDLRANGGTNIEQALQEAFRPPDDPEHLDIVLFLTDGLPSVGEQNPERLAQQAERSRGNARVFAFGVGYDVNTYLLDRLSAAGHGSTQYVTPGQDVEQALGALVTKISYPVLTDLRIVHAPARLTQLYPEHLPDLFAGEELVVFGRYAAGSAEDSQDADDPSGLRPAAGGTLVLEGRRAGRVERFEVRVAFPDHATGNDYIPRLWAARKIGVLTQQIKLNGVTRELEQDVKDTALRYGLLTEYTSYLVQEPSQVALHPGLRLDEVVVAGAAAPAQASGRVAVAAAERAQESRQLKSVAALNAQEMEVTKRAHGPTMQTIAGRIFVLRDGVWTDLWHADSIAVVHIAPFTDAYFAVLARLPELMPYWKEMDHVLVSGRRTSIQLDPDGLATLSDARLDRLARDFRGR
jgi:Ca-activated chloride channel homolog